MLTYVGWFPSLARLVSYVGQKPLSGQKKDASCGEEIVSEISILEALKRSASRWQDSKWP